MKVNSIINSTHTHAAAMRGSGGRDRAAMNCAGTSGLINSAENYAVKLKKKNQNSYDNINTGIKSSSDARVSFKGGGVPLLYRAAHFADKNPIAADALFILPVACILKPLTLLSMAKTEDEKKKYRYQAAKGAASGIAGLIMALAIGRYIKKGVKLADKKGFFDMPEEMRKKSQAIVDKGIEALQNTASQLKKTGASSELTQMIEKLTGSSSSEKASGRLNINVFNNEFDHFSKPAVKNFISDLEKISPDAAKAAEEGIMEQKVMNSYQCAAKDTANKLFQPVFLPLRTKITFYSIPIILGIFGIKKHSAKSAAPKEQQAVKAGIDIDSEQNKTAAAVFQTFTGVKK